MIALFGEGTESTPLVKYEPERKILRITGYSYPENPQEFYKPLCDWLEQRFRSQDSALNLIFEIEFLNTISTRLFLRLLKMVQEWVHKGRKIKVTWFYDRENEMGLEYGIFFREALNISVQLKEKNSYP